MSLWVTDAPSAVPALLTPHMVLARLLPTATPEQLSHLLPCTLAPKALQITEGGSPCSWYWCQRLWQQEDPQCARSVQ